MALILGDEVTTVDLVPIFNGFLRDLDEVRIGVLKHFADFVKVSFSQDQIEGRRFNSFNFKTFISIPTNNHSEK